jgi:hypothetical protein
MLGNFFKKRFQNSFRNFCPNVRTTNFWERSKLEVWQQNKKLRIFWFFPKMGLGWVLEKNPLRAYRWKPFRPGTPPPILRVFANFFKNDFKTVFEQILNFFLSPKENFWGNSKTQSFCKKTKPENFSIFYQVFEIFFSKNSFEMSFEKFYFVAKWLFGLMAKSAFGHTNTLPDFLFFNVRTKFELSFEKIQHPCRVTF